MFVTEGVPLDVILLVSFGLVAAASLVACVWRSLGQNDRERGANGSERTDETGDAAPGRLARHPGGECPICLSAKFETPVQTNCGHWFCARCILGYYDGLGRAPIKCPLCRQDVNMLYGAAEDPQAAPAAPVADSQGTGAEIDSAPAATPVTTAAPATPTSPLGSPETRERIARFNERNSRRRRSPWQVIEDAPLLLRRLWSDLRRGDTQVFRELIRRGVQLQLFVAALYILSPVDMIPEGLLGIFGLLDDLFVALVVLLHLTSVYRTILLSWERSRAARAAAALASGGGDAGVAAPAVAVSGEGRSDNSLLGVGVAAVLAVLTGTLVTFAGLGSGVAALAAGAMGVAVAAAASSSSARAMMPPLAADW